MNRRERARAYRRPLAVPVAMPAGRRVTIGPDAIRAGFDAHKGHEHGGRIGFACPTCSNYLAAVTAARVAQRPAGPTP